MLKRFRDAIVHLKSKDMYTGIKNIDRESLYYIFLNNEPRIYPNLAWKTIKYFLGEKPPRWAIQIERLLEK
jgi:hypothetical protein